MTFYYGAVRADGLRVNGSIGAESAEAVLAHLRARGLFVTAVERAQTARGAFAGLRQTVLRSRTERSAFFRSFATLIGVGIPIKRALETLLAQTRDAAFGETLQSLCADVEAGTALSVAMERHAADFSAVAIAMVRAGEASGSLAQALASIADLEERQRALRKRVAAALAYPAIVSLAATGLVVFLIAQTMPAFAGMFAEMGVSLPPITRGLIAAGQVVREPAVWTLASSAVAVLTATLWLVRRESVFASVVDVWRLRVPVVGELIRKALVVRFSRTLGSLLSAGIDVVAALETSLRVGGNTFERRFAGALERLRSGDTFAETLEASGLFDPTFSLLVRVGEESGTLDAMLLRVASYYETDLEAGLAALTAAIEPALICVLGVAIGTIVASIILPLYSMIGSIQ